MLRISARILLITLFCFFSITSGDARAACTNPPGNEGDQVYNGTHKVMQFCDGTNWWSMKGGGGVASNAGECQDGETVIYNASSGGFECPFDHTPDTFSFTDQTGVEPSTVTESEIVQIVNLDDATPISISGNGSPEYRICADATCSGAPAYTSSAGTINDGDYLQLHLTSHADWETTNSATVTIGEASDQWDVMTKAGSCNLPWGGTIADGDSVTAYLNSSEPCGGSCTSETRTCSDGVLSGSYTNSSCSVSSCASCGATSFGSGNSKCNVPSLPHGGSGGTCVDGGSCSYTCNNGSLSGSNNCFAGGE